MEKFKELSFEESLEIDGGGLISLGTVAAVCGIVMLCVWAYNEAGDVIKGWNDAKNGVYEPPKKCY